MYGSVFAVNRSTGELLVRGSVDYEQRSDYSLVVVARDRLGASHDAKRLSSRVQVTVNVTDVNDCSPLITVNSLSPLGISEVLR